MTKEDLIEETRRKMIISIKENGYLNKKTIELSQELDVYILEQQKLGMELLRKNRCNSLG
ncbi:MULTISPECIES: aspartyl-phosphate phosphatase Spo0E family protein [Mesobacillus]|uniref:aspartyl-phosphate phosphatase Spo0E family protein n=1 Tax=Mesobacillus TaxID=2675231 RepID=UPI001781D61A|nr:MULTISPECIES: aspartyl-phosphate phosphatase Spo0E family protein [Mesobacillus]MCM3575977.1 aspartyl-phosphate phosphatase Spo0E family protein [Mesobacillus subterraneus]UYZ22565.1 aspartyl-phosphate phosphatase Spo0E family protein [Mesobacillus jeotgali]